MTCGWPGSGGPPPERRTGERPGATLPGRGRRAGAAGRVRVADAAWWTVVRVAARCVPAAAGAWWAVVACAAPAPATLPALDGAAATVDRFWDRFERADDLREASPDSALRVARAELDRDPESLLGHWLLAAAIARLDSAAAGAAADSAAAIGDRPGPQVFAGSLRLARGRVAEGRAALDRAGDLYLVAGRPHDAARAALWKAMLDRTPRGGAADGAYAAAESLALAHGIGEAVAEIRIQNASRLLRTDVEAAIAAARRAVEAAAASPTLLALAHRQLGIGFQRHGRSDSAEFHHELAARLARDVPHPLIQARCLQSLAVARMREARYGEALVTLDSALARVPAHRPEARASLLSERGNMLRSLLRLEEARASFEDAIAIYETGDGTASGVVHSLDGLGATLSQLGDLDAGAALFERALAEARRLGVRAAEPFLHQHLAVAAFDVGDFDRAARAIEDGLRAARETRQPPIEAALLSLRAELLLERGEPERALAETREAVRQSRGAGARRVGERLWFEGRVLRSLGRHAEALAVSDTLRAMALAAGDPGLLADADELAGESLLGAGRAAAAVERLRFALARSDSLGVRREAAGTRRALGRALLAAGSPAAAARELEAAVAVHEDVGRTLAASEERGSMHALWQSSYVDLATAHARSGDLDAAFRTVDRSRAREMRRLFGRPLAAGAGPVPAALAREVARVERDLAAAQSELLARQGLEAGTRAVTVTQLSRRCDGLKARWSDLMRRIERASPGWARAAGLGAPLALADARRRLRDGEALLAYLVGTDHALAIAVWRDGAAARELPWRDAELRRRVESYVAALQSHGDDGWMARAAGLADTLLPEGLLPASTRTLLLVPDAALHRLPFETLRPRGPAGARATLIERCAVVLGDAPSLLVPAPAARAGGGGGATAAAAGALIAFGDPATPAAPADGRRALLPSGPLPNARREVEGLRGLWPGATVFVGPEATEGRFLAALESASILHVAAHGFVDDRYPRFSGLVMAPGPDAGGAGADGIVQAWEVLARRGSPVLVTLSACETGRGQLLRGEGLVGLARAFRLAGARNLVVSLWKVDDAATADLMLDFYRRLRTGLAAAEALRAAKLAVLAGGTAAAGGASRGIGTAPAAVRRSHPSAWAAFVLQGAAPR